MITFSRKSYGPGKWKQIQEKMEIKEVIFVVSYFHKIFFSKM